MLLCLLVAGCIKPDVESKLDVKSAIATLELNSGEWTPGVTSAITAALNDTDYRVKARGLVSVINFPASCPPSTRDLVQEVAKSNPDTQGVEEALRAVGLE